MAPEYALLLCPVGVQPDEDGEAKSEPKLETSWNQFRRPRLALLKHRKQTQNRKQCIAVDKDKCAVKLWFQLLIYYMYILLCITLKTKQNILLPMSINHYQCHWRKKIKQITISVHKGPFSRFYPNRRQAAQQGREQYPGGERRKCWREELWLLFILETTAFQP